jgi:hypothetical protein
MGLGLTKSKAAKAFQIYFLNSKTWNAYLITLSNTVFFTLNPRVFPEVNLKINCILTVFYMPNFSRVVFYGICKHIFFNFAC